MKQLPLVLDKSKSTNSFAAFTGYGSTFNVIDQYNDVILLGAFSETIKNRKIKLLWQHDATQPIGIIDAIKEDRFGLYMEARILLDIKQGAEAAALLEAGVMSGLSIGYQVKESRLDSAKGVRYITKLNLWEVSIVTFPANQSAEVISLIRPKILTDLDMAITEAARSLR